MSLLSNISKWYFSKRALPYWCILILDCLVTVFSGYLSVFAFSGAHYLAANFMPLTWGILISLVFYIIAFRIFHTYSGVVRYSSFVDLERISAAVFMAAVLTWAAGELIEVDGIIFPRVLSILLMALLSGALLWLERVTVKTMFDVFRISESTQRAFIYGIRDGGVAIAKSIQNMEPRKYSLAGFVSAEGPIEAKFLMGVQIRRDGPNLVKHMKDANASVMIVAPQLVDLFRSREELVSELINNDIKILMMQDGEEWDGKSDLHQTALHEVEIEDLLPRDQIEVDMDAIGNLLRGKKILITGAAGSIGSEMVRQIAVYNPAEMILIDQAETPMHDIRLLMARKFPEIKAQTIVTSICNEKHMDLIFSAHRPDYVFHAAAYKHVPMMEDNPGMAVQNNIAGTRIIADLAVKYGTKKFVMISTDKAVNPTNVMGCSKRICEIYCQSLNQAVKAGTAPKQADGSPAVTQFVTTRFGNVLGSNGSVIPIFREQIRRGGPITVTHPDIIRFFMLIPEACKLVLEAGTMGKGGEIFVFDMGKPVRIVDLAKRMIKLSGAENIEIKFTGLRDGEKLYEEVLNDAEQTTKTPNPKIMVAKVREYDYETALANEKRLLEASYSFDDMEIVRIMKEIVPEYRSQCSKYEILDK